MASSMKRIISAMKRKLSKAFSDGAGQAPGRKNRKISARIANAKNTGPNLGIQILGRVDVNEHGVLQAAPAHPTQTASPSAERPTEEDQPPLQPPHPPARYIVVDGGGNVYTDGAPDLKWSHDGRKRCVALYPNQELVDRMTTFIDTDRALELEKERSGHEQRILSLFRNYAQRRKRELLEERDDLERIPGNETEMIACERKARALRSKMALANRRESNAEDRIRASSRAARDAQVEFALSLNDILEQSGLLPPLPDFGDDEELLRTFAVPQSNAAPPSESEMSTTLTENFNREERPSRVSRSAQAKAREDVSHAENPSRSILELYVQASRDFNQAQDNFDAREHDRDNEAASFLHRRGLSSPPSETAESFDIRHVQRARELTKQLIEAEEKYRAAKARALAAGINIHTTNLSSGFADRDSDGADSGRGDAHITQERMHPSTLEQWLDDLPEDNSESKSLQSPGSETADKWDSRTVAICDSLSVIADENDRRRIDRWREICEQYRP